MKTSYYNKRKAAARNKAIEWQNEVNKLSLSWWDTCHMADHFERLGRRYGLLREFMGNGII